MRRRARALPVRRHKADAGFTILEMLFGMAIMAIFMVVFSGAINSMFRSANASQALANASQSLNIAFGKLDLIMRYAAYVSAPGQSAGNWYVEVGLKPLPTDANARKTAPTDCEQLRINTARNALEIRRWDVSTAGVAGPVSTWTPLATNVRGGTPQPFQLVQATPSSIVRTAQITFNLTAWDGSGVDSRTTSTAITFAAMNTTNSTPSSGICNQWGRS
jgi:prepilin-type N-terminal cleavage/methylation domain-containing protein